MYGVQVGIYLIMHYLKIISGQVDGGVISKQYSLTVCQGIRYIIGVQNK